jgi:hypothetical protein
MGFDETDVLLPTDRLRILAPQAMQGTTFHKYVGANPTAVMNGEPLHIENQSAGIPFRFLQCAEII